MAKGNISELTEASVNLVRSLGTALGTSLRARAGFFKPKETSLSLSSETPVSVDEALTESTPESLELPAYIRYGFMAMHGTLEQSLSSDTPINASSKLYGTNLNEFGSSRNDYALNSCKPTGARKHGNLLRTSKPQILSR